MRLLLPLALLALLASAMPGLAGPLSTSALPGHDLRMLHVKDADGMSTHLRFPTSIAFRGDELIVMEAGRYAFGEPFVGQSAGRILALDLSGNEARARVLATGLQDPVGLTVANDGTIYFTQYGVVSALGADGVVRTFASGLPPTRGDTTFVPTTDWNAGADVTSSVGLGAMFDLHTTGTLGLAFGPDGALYATQGLNGRPAEDPLLGGRDYAVDLSSSILRLDGGAVSTDDTVARGCRNCYELAFAPAGSPYAGRLFATEATDFYSARVQAGSGRSVGESTPADANVFDGLNEVVDGRVRRVATFEAASPTLAAVPTGIAFAPAAFDERVAGLPIVTLWSGVTPGSIVAVLPDETGLGASVPLVLSVTTPIDLAFADDGTLYFVEFDTGRLFRLGPKVI